MDRYYHCILDRCEKNDNVYIPYEIAPYSPGRIILASCDNIDLLKETIDGKNTFHCTQMMLWQQGPKNERSDDESPKIGRGRTLNPDKLAPIHKLDHVFIPKERPNPVFHSDVQITPENWFNNGKQKESKLKDTTWLLPRNYDKEQVIPSWTAFNEAVSLVSSRTTTSGMLPILQAPTDDNSTVARVINRFNMDITSKLVWLYEEMQYGRKCYKNQPEMYSYMLM